MGKIDVIKKRMFEIIEVSHEHDLSSRAYDHMMAIAVIVGLIPLTIKANTTFRQLIDLTTAVLFLIDYVLRIFTSDYKMGVKSYKAYLYYAFTPMALVDLLSTVPIIAFFLPHSMTLGLFRLFRVLRILKLVRYSKTMTIITNVLRNVKRELLAVLVLALAYIFASAMVIFQVEPDLFRNFFEAVYWSTVSITTIGYGDIAPVTSIGRLVTMISALVGVAVIALPSGIITAGYMEEVKKKKSKLEI